MKTIEEVKSNGSAPITDLDAYKQLQAARDAADWEQTLEYTQTGGVKSSSAANIRKILTHDPKFAEKLSYNVFTKQVVTTGKIKTDNFTMTSEVGNDDGTLVDDLQAMIDDEYKVTFNNKLVTSAVLYAARQQSFNPLLDRLTTARKQWCKAGEPKQLENIFIDTLGAEDTPATRAMTRLFFDGLVTRAHKAGTEFHYMTILYSQKQGIGKTTLLRKLGGDYYFDNLADLHDKDTLQMTACSWLVNDEELAAITDYRHNSTQSTKAFITRAFDFFRAPYTPEPKKYKRQFALVGTTNKQDLLNDFTGARRYNPITCGVDEIKTPVPSLTDDDIMLYLGEAEDRYRRDKCQLVASQEEQAAIDEAKKAFEVVDETQETLDMVLSALFPAKWWDQDPVAQRTWILNILAGEEEKNDAPAPVEVLDRINIAWAMTAIFNLGRSYAGEPQYKRLYAKIAALMDSNPDWEKSAHVIKFGKVPKRGYRLIKK